MEKASIKVVAQYIKDLSFENPSAPLKPEQLPKKVNIEIDVHANKTDIADTFEIGIKIKASAKKEEKNIFIIELVYAALMSVTPLTTNKQDLEKILLIDCPHIIFPFARRIMADLARDGRLPIPLLLEPISFSDLYKANISKDVKK